MVHDGALQRRHDLLAIVDGQSNVAVKQALPALVDADLLSARVAKFVPTLNHDRPFHRCRFVSGQNDGDGLFEPNNPCPTPKNYRSQTTAFLHIRAARQPSPLLRARRPQRLSLCYLPAAPGLLERRLRSPLNEMAIGKSRCPASLKMTLSTLFALGCKTMEQRQRRLFSCSKVGVSSLGLVCSKCTCCLCVSRNPLTQSERVPAFSARPAPFPRPR